MPRQRHIDASDLESVEYTAVPDAAKPLALWLWLNSDPWGRRPLDPEWIATQTRPKESQEIATLTVLEHLLAMIDAGFLSTYRADGSEWIALQRPLKCDSRRAEPWAPDPPDQSWTVMAVGGAGARERARGRARARAGEQVRAEGAARADAWAAVEADREPAPERPERPWMLDAPPPFCPEHMPAGTRKKCGPCRDARIYRDIWIDERTYTERLAEHYEKTDEETW